VGSSLLEYVANGGEHIEFLKELSRPLLPKGHTFFDGEPDASEEIAR
jgi:hypothetical protein